MPVQDRLYRWRVLVLCENQVHVTGEYWLSGVWNPLGRISLPTEDQITIEFTDGTTLEIGELTSLSSGPHTMQQTVNLVHAGPAFTSLRELPYEDKSEHGDSGGWYHSCLTHELEVQGFGLGLDSINWDSPM